MLEVDDVGFDLVEERPEQLFHPVVAIRAFERDPVEIGAVDEPDGKAVAVLVVHAVSGNVRVLQAREDGDVVSGRGLGLGDSERVDRGPGELVGRQLVRDVGDAHAGWGRRKSPSGFYHRKSRASGFGNGAFTTENTVITEETSTSGAQTTRRTMPSFSKRTLKLIRRPTGKPPRLRYVMSWDSWIGRTLSTDFTSMTTLIDEKVQSIGTTQLQPLNVTGRGTCRRKGMRRRVSS